MENPIIREHLKTINSLSPNTALWVFIKAFGDFYGKASKLPLEQIDHWVKEFKDPKIQQDWSRQRRRKYPHIFIYWMLWHYKFQTMQEKKYQRDNSTGVRIPKSDWHKYTSTAQQITKYVSSLSFAEGVAFLGELIGAWVLTCPEVIVRSDNYVERIGERRTGKKGTDWEVPVEWIKWSYAGDAREKVSDKETQLMYVLDFLLYFAFNDYDTANTD